MTPSPTTKFQSDCSIRAIACRSGVRSGKVISSPELRPQGMETTVGDINRAKSTRSRPARPIIHRGESQCLATWCTMFSNFQTTENRFMTRHRYSASMLLLVILALAISPAFAETIPDKSRPNLVVIFMDEMGYEDVEPFGSKQNRTLNLTQMAAEGSKPTSFYVASPVCTPSRAALMTSCYPQRLGLKKGSGHIVLFPGDESILVWQKPRL